jgi:hypothetical protein
VTPIDQTSAAGPIGLLAISGASYTDRSASTLAIAPAKRRPSAESFKQSPAAMMFMGFSRLWTKPLACK